MNKGMIKLTADLVKKKNAEIVALKKEIQSLKQNK